jgi:hypothetical protein
MMPRPETAHPTTLLFLLLLLRPFVSLYFRLSFPFFSFFVPPHLLSMALLILRSPASCFPFPCLTAAANVDSIKNQKKKKKKREEEEEEEESITSWFPPSS